MGLELRARKVSRLEYDLGFLDFIRKQPSQLKFVLVDPKESRINFI